MPHATSTRWSHLLQVERDVSVAQSEGDVVSHEASVGALLLLRSMGLNVEGRSSDGRGHC
jgi:hypothetical protein